MSDTLLPPGLTSCDQEPIHAPGSIQPHGMAIVAEHGSLIVRHVAGDVERRLGVSGWAGQPLNGLIGDALSVELYAIVKIEGQGGFVGQLRTAFGELLDVSIQLGKPFVIVELESAASEGLSASRAIDRLGTVAANFERTSSLLTLCERAAIEFRRLTGFDRVMVYRFLDDGAGRVLAEDRRDGLGSFLNHHFPASDIPRQARELYIRNPVRGIPNASYEPVVFRPAWKEPAPLDMGNSILRSVSPTHLLYLRNMGVAASASFSIIKDGLLWGLIACHHESPRRLTYDVRAACRLLAGSLSRQIKAKEEAEGLKQRLRLRSFEGDITALLSHEGSLDTALSNHLEDIGRMMNGNGIAIVRGRELIKNGGCPGDADIRLVATWLLNRPLEPIFSTGCLPSLYPPAEQFAQVGSGLLAMTLSPEEPWLMMWFRAERIEHINWAGNPHKNTGSDAKTPLSPRASFATWAETVRGRARAWSISEVDAAIRLRSALLDMQQNRRVADLNGQLTRILQDKDSLLQQKEFLVGEVNHRVQNSLMLVSSFLNLQARESSNPELHTALEEARRRLTAVALVHRRLYRGDQIEVVDAARYIGELCEDTFSFMGNDWRQHLGLNLAPLLLSTDKAVSLGLILTELLINSNKHAYGGVAGPVEVELIEGGSHFHLVVADRGVSEAITRKGFGSRMIDGLVKQLNGRLVQSDNKPGLRVTVTVPIQVVGNVGANHIPP